MNCCIACYVKVHQLYYIYLYIIHMPYIKNTTAREKYITFNWKQQQIFNRLKWEVLFIICFWREWLSSYALLLSWRFNVWVRNYVEEELLLQHTNKNWVTAFLNWPLESWHSLHTNRVIALLGNWSSDFSQSESEPEPDSSQSKSESPQSKSKSSQFESESELPPQILNFAEPIVGKSTRTGDKMEAWERWYTQIDKCTL